VTARIRQGRGFTLIEVLVALFIVALGIGALLATLTSAATTVDHLRDKSFAQWVALNQITQARLASTSTGTGSSSGEVDYAGNKWYWRQQVVDQGIAGMRRIDVEVSRSASPESSALATAVGFMGQKPIPPNGRTPAWTVEATPGPPDGGAQKKPGDTEKTR
jgi:general secretion pathway protein I